MLGADGEAVDVHGYGHHDLAGTAHAGRPRSVPAATRRRRHPSGLHPLPLGPSVLEPDFHLQREKNNNDFTLKSDEGLVH